MKYIIAIIALCAVMSTSAQNKTFTVNGQTFEMVKIEGGTFKMGVPLSLDKTNYYTKCRPVHDVTLSTYYVGKFPVTQKLWSAVMGELDCPSLIWGDNFPVDNITWYDDAPSSNRTYPWTKPREWSAVEVDKEKANQLGIYGVDTGLKEWCSDYYDEEYYAKSPKIDPRGATSGDERSIRQFSYDPPFTRFGESPRHSNSSITMRLALNIK